MMAIDTGQKASEMDSEGLKDIDLNQKTEESDLNQRNNQQDTISRIMDEDQLKVFLFKMEFKSDNPLKEDEMKTMLQNYIH